MRVIIFGGSGFLGTNLAIELLKKKLKVTIFDKKRPNNKLKGVRFIRGSIDKYQSVLNAIKGHQYVYNLAGISDIEEALKDPFGTVKINILGTINTLEAAKKFKIKKYIFASSIYVLSSQGGTYRVSKKSSELFIQEYGNRYNLNYVILRFGSIFGIGADRRNGISKIISNFKKNKVLKYSGTSKAVRKFIHIKDAAILSANVLSKKFKKTSVLVTGNKNIKISTIMKYLKKRLGIKKKIVYSNKTALGHYDKNPYSYKAIPFKKMKLKPKKDFTKNLVELVKSFKIYED